MSRKDPPRHKALLNSEKNDPDQLRALNVLKGLTSSMLSTNGDLFNNTTSAEVDKVGQALRTVYDFSRLMRRGRAVAMAQLVNVISFAVATLDMGDVVIVHGTEHIDDRVKAYLSSQFAHLADRGGRVVYSYNDVDKMLADHGFNKFDTADWTVLGRMRDATVEEYQRLLHQQIPPDLVGLVTNPAHRLSYLRRGMTNVVFHADLTLGVNRARAAQRRDASKKARDLAEHQRVQDAVDGVNKAGANMSGAAHVAAEHVDVAARVGADRDRRATDGADTTGE